MDVECITHSCNSGQGQVAGKRKLPRAHHAVGHAVAQLVEALRYKSEGRGCDSPLCHWNFSLT